MSGYSNSIPTKIFGLNRQDVDKYFQGLKNDYDSELEKLVKQKKLLERELEKLLKELSEAGQEVIKYEDEYITITDETSEELISSAVERLKKTKDIIGMIAEEEIEQLKKNASDKLEEYENTIERLQGEIEESKEKIESTLSNVTKVIKSNMADMEIGDKKTPTDQRIKEIQEAVKMVDNLAVNEEQEKVTADGTSLSYINKISKFKKKYMPSTDDEEEEIVERLHKKSKQKSKDYDDLLNLDNVDDFDDSYLVKDLLDEIMVDEEEHQSTQETQGNEHNDENIKDMRNSLIIGKIAGEDLHDNDNNIIVQKNKILTAEDIELAEKASKLPELIINMVLPE